MMDKIRFYDKPRSQIDNGAKCSLTKNIYLLRDVKLFDDEYKPRLYMKGDTSDQPNIPVGEGKLRVKAITKDGHIDKQFYYSPHFTSTLLSDWDVLCSSPFTKDFSGQILTKYFDLNNEELHNNLQNKGRVDLNHKKFTNQTSRVSESTVNYLQVNAIILVEEWMILME